MKIGEIARPNSKGQVVIPKQYRKALGISPDIPLHLILQGDGIYLHPVRDVVGFSGSKDAYLKVLNSTQGAWGKERKRTSESSERHILEIKRSQARKKIW